MKLIQEDKGSCRSDISDGWISFPQIGKMRQCCGSALEVVRVPRFLKVEDKMKHADWLPTADPYILYIYTSRSPIQMETLFSFSQWQQITGYALLHPVSISFQSDLENRPSLLLAAGVSATSVKHLNSTSVAVVTHKQLPSSHNTKLQVSNTNEKL